MKSHVALEKRCADKDLGSYGATLYLALQSRLPVVRDLSIPERALLRLADFLRIGGYPVASRQILGGNQPNLTL